ncbi:MAG: hypothetical protein AAF206_29355 [Bacteroidota bacterium]
MLDIVMYIILGSIGLLLAGVINQQQRNRRLHREFDAFDCEVLLIQGVGQNVQLPQQDKKLTVLEVDRNRPDWKKSFCYQIMRKTGVQSLPMKIWRSESGELKAVPL